MATLDEIRLQELLANFEPPQGIARLNPLAFKYQNALYPGYEDFIGAYSQIDPNAPRYEDFIGAYSQIDPNAPRYEQFMSTAEGLAPTSDFGYPYAPANRLGGLDLKRFEGVSELGRQDADVEQVESETEPSGIAKLLQYLPFGKKSIAGYLLDKFLPKESPEIKSMKNFYRSQYGLTPTGQVASGIMAGYNPVYGGLLNMITGGRFGEPTQYGLADAARRRIERIATRKAPQTDASRAKIAELQRFAEADTISRARQAAPDVYARAEANKALGPGGGFSTSGSKRDSGFQSASSRPSGRGRQDY